MGLHIMSKGQLVVENVEVECYQQNRSCCHDQAVCVVCFIDSAHLRNILLIIR